MNRNITMFTGQWADIPLAELLPQLKAMGLDGVELCCWGDHFDVSRYDDVEYMKEKWALLEKNGLNCFAISSHLVGQCICDRIDERHKAILPAYIWGDGDAEGVRQRAAQEMINTAKACKLFMSLRPASLAKSPLEPTVCGFTGSSIWHLIYSFPPTPMQMIDAGYEDFANRFIPILDEFDKLGVNFALEVHPTEIAFDIASSQRALEAVKFHKRFGFNYDPSHFGYQGVDYVKFIRKFSDRIYHAHMKDAWWGHGNGDVGVFGGHTEFTDPRRYWDFRSIGHGDINFKEIMVALNDIKYKGPLSIEWEDGRMDRFFGASESIKYIRSIDFPSSNVIFDSAFDNANQ